MENGEIFSFVWEFVSHLLVTLVWILRAVRSFVLESNLYNLNRIMQCEKTKTHSMTHLDSGTITAKLVI